ncbi:SGNH/GDSL hydrolase family protein [Pseudomonas arsenicoxydans]|uniref:SGNH hydrolase-type esterase domain-containing protein n=1 Tax=Pseudomonas arsenicoxydans TaxID=702115 RepID=A0A4P6GIU9_9PSED|nr:SGNH/GDSL hydrolase family protein [Pseudomonas arsenicoxydans]QAY85411.1 hypothetical protein CUN61_16045 [Pseudomonas arsenicoxydans]
MRFYACLVLFFVSLSCFSAQQCTLQVSSTAKSLYAFGYVNFDEFEESSIWFSPSVGNIVPSNPQEISPTSFNYNTLYRLTDQFGGAWYFRFSGEWFDSGNTQRTAFYSVQWSGGQRPTAPGRYLIESVDSIRTQLGALSLTTIGDSMTWFGDAQSLRCYLSAYLPNYKFTGRYTDSFGFGHEGHGGDATSDIIARLPGMAVSDAYFLLIGANDNLSPVDATSRNIGVITDNLLAKNKNAKIYIGTLPPRGDEYADSSVSRNAAIRGWYSTYKNNNSVTLIDINEAMNSVPSPVLRFISPDRIHPNLIGHDLIAQMVSSAVKSQGVTCGAAY